MLCFVVSKERYELVIKDKLTQNSFLEENTTCIGSFGNLQEVYNFAHTFPCLTEVKVHGVFDECAFILCQV